MGEHLLCKQGVVGSNPSVSRTVARCRSSVVRPVVMVTVAAWAVVALFLWW